ncbi:hypothetical protein DRO27_00090 [Candidatus Bathyarchaeota archaeon]|nr:MAG: hypothetical protein DRO27_00090 [Candidatus Bathyarchaeota archaeon]
MNVEEKTTTIAGAFITTSLVGSAAAWGTHIITCIMNEQYLFLIAGAIAAPVGIVHGVGIWFGAW